MGRLSLRHRRRRLRSGDFFLGFAAPDAGTLLVLDDLGAAQPINEALSRRTKLSLDQLDEDFARFARKRAGRVAVDATWEEPELPADADSKAMLDVVADLEANGRSLQHFSRELARYVRNLLVVKISKGATRLVAATPGEQERLLATARGTVRS